MVRIEKLWDRRNRTPVLIVIRAINLVLALIDWRTKPYFSLGFLYLFPIMLAGGFLPRWAIVLLSVACAVLSEVFSSLDPSGQFVRLASESLALGRLRIIRRGVGSKPAVNTRLRRTITRPGGNQPRRHHYHRSTWVYRSSQSCRGGTDRPPRWTSDWTSHCRVLARIAFCPEARRRATVSCFYAMQWTSR